MSGTHILVVDDTAIYRKQLAAILGRKGYQVTTADSREDAFRMLEGGLNPDLLLTDIHMGTDHAGIELIKQVKTVEALQRMPIIAYSSELESSMELAREAGANAVITKASYTSTLLFDAIEKLLGRPAEQVNSHLLS